jgi:hypothetical protein
VGLFSLTFLEVLMRGTGGKGSDVGEEEDDLDQYSTGSWAG